MQLGMVGLGRMGANMVRRLQTRVQCCVTNTSFAPLRTVAIIAMVAILTTLSCLMWVLPATGDAVVAAVAAAAWSVALDYRNQRTETR